MPLEVSTIAYSAAVVVGAVVAYALVFLLFHRWVNRLVEAMARVDYLQPFIRLTRYLAVALDIVAFGVVALGVVLGVLALLGFNIGPTASAIRQWATGALGWLLAHGLRIFLILVAASLGAIFIRRRVPRWIHATLTRGKEGVALEEAEQRAQTLGGVVSGTGVVLVFALALFMTLSEIGVNIGPVLVGLGVVGIAVGFGAQYLVRDLINGFFILLENQYSKGDVVRIAGIAGLVEDFNLRRTVLRDLDGIVHFIPNGEVTTASNFTKDWSRMNLNIPVAYKEDLDRVMEVINRVGAEMYADPYYRELLLEAPKALRVDNFADSGIEIKVLAMTKPIRQWEVAGEFRRRIKRAFDQEGIEIPFPHLTVYWGQGAHPLSALLPELERLRQEGPGKGPTAGGQG